MTTTYKDLVDETLHTLHGVVADLEQVTELKTSIADNALSFTVDDASQISRGIIEIGDELFWVKSTDQSTNTVYLNSFGRGFRQSTATTHSAGDMVTNGPKFPRVLVKAALQETAQAMHPQVYAIRTDETNTAIPGVTTYGVPADCDWIIAVEFQLTGSSGQWKSARRYRLDVTADSSAFPTGKSVDIFDAMAPGQTIKVTYAGSPGAFVDDTDTLADVGLGEACRDILVYGACSRLLMGVEAGRLNTAAVEQSERDALVTAGSATNVSMAFYQLYQIRLAAERSRLQQLFSTTSHMVR